MPDSRGLVLIIEDERAIADLQRLYLVDAGYGVHIERDGAAGLAAAERLHPVAIVLDVGLPTLNGIEVCRALRDSGNWTPVIFVTARDEEVDRIVGLELGADDYLTKPFSPRELVVRLKNILRRQTGAVPAPVLSLGRLSLFPEQRRLEVDGTALALTPTEFDLMAKLLGSPGRVFTREMLLSSVWGQVDYAGGRTVDVHIAQLRSKLGDASPIVTFRGTGYSVAVPS